MNATHNALQRRHAAGSLLAFAPLLYTQLFFQQPSDQPLRFNQRLLALHHAQTG